MDNIIEFLLNFILAMITGLAVITIVTDLVEDKKKQAIPALICFATVYFRMGLVWAASEGGKLSLQTLAAKDPVTGFLAGTFFKTILLVCTVFSVIWWRKSNWIKAHLPIPVKK